VEILQFFEFSKWPPLPSWIFEIEKFYWLLGRRGSRHISVQNFVKIGQSVVKILRFFDFTRWRPPPSWILEFTKFYWLTVAGWPRRITLPNFVIIGRSIAEMLQLFESSKWPRYYFGFLKSRNFIAYSGGEGLDASACQILSNRSIGCEDINIFHFFKMAAATIWIVEFTKFYWLSVSGGPIRIIAPIFRQNWLLRCRDIAIFRIFKLAATAILDF